jgi:ubiquinone/menaquinone biosynthesis C-methylase UbiE
MMESNYSKVTPADWDKFNWENIKEIQGRDRMRKVLKHIPSDGLHLDVGTGRGDGTYLVSQKKQTVGIDFGLRSLKIAAQKNRNLIQADGCILPFKSAIFESVTCLDVIEHIPEAEKAINEIYRVLKSEGRLVLQTPTIELIYIKTIISRLTRPYYITKAVLKKILYYKYDANEEYYPQPYDKDISIKKIRNMLVDNNFVIEKEKIVNYWHSNVLIRVFSFAKLFICVKGDNEYTTNRI